MAYSRFNQRLDTRAIKLLGSDLNKVNKQNDNVLFYTLKNPEFNFDYFKELVDQNCDFKLVNKNNQNLLKVLVEYQNDL